MSTGAGGRAVVGGTLEGSMESERTCGSTGLGARDHWEG